ncbi:hypothetical protein C3K23_26045 [Streptomyces sp. 604F]|nr:hypothetical protein C3K23_26045 [Streptomyces sp. 604F]
MPTFLLLRRAPADSPRRVEHMNLDGHLRTPRVGDRGGTCHPEDLPHLGQPGPVDGAPGPSRRRRSRRGCQQGEGGGGGGGDCSGCGWLIALLRHFSAAPLLAPAPPARPFMEPA